MVWRISQDSPTGQWVAKDTPLPKASPIDATGVTPGSWVTSSFDLLSGTDLRDISETIPGDLFDVLFPPPPDQKPKPGKG